MNLALDGAARRVSDWESNSQGPEVAVASQYNEVYTKRDLDGVLALFAPDPDAVVIN